MGVDIHAFIEKRNEKTNQWEEVTLYKDNGNGDKIPVRFYEGCRNSELFCLLAGVTGFNMCTLFNGCLVPTRGLPDGLSPTVSEEYGDGECFFSETWYDYCELSAYSYTLKIAVDMIKANVEDDDDEHYDEFDCYDVVYSLEDFMKNIDNVLNSYGIWYPNPNDVRIVMWFDH